METPPRWNKQVPGWGSRSGYPIDSLSICLFRLMVAHMVCHNPPIVLHHYLQFEPSVCSTVLIHSVARVGTSRLWIVAFPLWPRGPAPGHPTPPPHLVGIPGWYHGYSRVTGPWSRGLLSCACRGFRARGVGINRLGPRPTTESGSASPTPLARSSCAWRDHRGGAGQ